MSSEIFYDRAFIRIARNLSPYATMVPPIVLISIPLRDVKFRRNTGVS